MAHAISLSSNPFHPFVLLVLLLLALAPRCASLGEDTPIAASGNSERLAEVDMTTDAAPFPSSKLGM